MKATSTAVTNLINAARAAPDAPIAFAECFQFTTTTGTVYAWTNVDYPFAYNGLTFLCTGPLIAGLKYKGTVGLTSTSSRYHRGPADRPDQRRAVPDRPSRRGFRRRRGRPLSRLPERAGGASSAA